MTPEQRQAFADMIVTELEKADAKGEDDVAEVIGTLVIVWFLMRGNNTKKGVKDDNLD